jgi:hypothetical protein
MNYLASVIKKTGSTGFLLAAAVGLAAPGLAGAAMFDGSQNLVCVPTDAIQCEGAGECARTEVEALNLPKFLHIDFKKKQLRGTAAGATEETTSEIQNLEKLGDRTLLQGSQNGRGWSLSIDAITGDLTVAIADDDLAFVLFGVCQPR